MDLPIDFNVLSQFQDLSNLHAKPYVVQVEAPSQDTRVEREWTLHEIPTAVYVVENPRVAILNQSRSFLNFDELLPLNEEDEQLLGGMVSSLYPLDDGESIE